MKIIELKKGALKKSLIEMDTELPVFFKNLKVKEYKQNPKLWEVQGTDEFPVYNSKASSCKLSSKPISKLYLINE